MRWYKYCIKCGEKTVFGRHLCVKCNRLNDKRIVELENEVLKEGVTSADMMNAVQEMVDDGDLIEKDGRFVLTEKGLKNPKYQEEDEE